MTDLIPADKIEQIVGTHRRPSTHIARAISSEQRVYILHSETCRTSIADPRHCAYSRALDRGIHTADWFGFEDRPVMVTISKTGRLAPSDRKVTA